jgi:hypothetical protein
VLKARRRWSRADAIVLVLVAAAITALGLAGASRNRRHHVPVTRLSVTSAPAGQAIPAGFLGLSIEYPAIEQYAGDDPAALNPRFVQLLRTIAGPAPVLRIGGDSTDSSWWPVAGLARPPGVTYALTPQWLAVAASLTRELNARLLLGVNLEADSPALAGAEATALIGAVGRGAVLALEPGNEPELYGAFPYYRTAAGRRVTGRPRSYNFAAFAADFAGRAAALPADVPLAGPAASGPGWMHDVGEFVTADPRVRVVTLHRYPLQLCYAGYRPTVAQLLSDAASHGFAQNFTATAGLVHRAGRTLRIDELNTVSCGADRAVSQSFAAALWALDALFELVRAGVDGVNLHTFPGAGYDLFRFRHAGGRWTALVAPEYYGLQMFAHAAPAGARLLRVVGAGEGSLKVWAVDAPDGRIHVVLIDKGGRRTVAVRVSGAAGPASIERLSGTLRTATPVQPSGGAYLVTLPGRSAAMLTVRRR